MFLNLAVGGPLQALILGALAPVVFYALTAYTDHRGWRKLPPIIEQAPEAPPADSNGNRVMEWCTCGSQADSAPVTIDGDGDGEPETTIGWLCPDCRGDRHGPDPERPPQPPHGPGAVVTRTGADGGPATGKATDVFGMKPKVPWGTPAQYTAAQKTLADVLPQCGYCGQPHHGPDGTHTYRPHMAPVLRVVEDPAVTKAKGALALIRDQLDAIYSECSTDSLNVYMSEEQAAEANVLYEDARALRSLIDSLTAEQDTCDHEWEEIRSDSGGVLSRFCARCDRRERA